MMIAQSYNIAINKSLSHLSVLNHGLAEKCIMWKSVVSFVISGENGTICP